MHVFRSIVLALFHRRRLSLEQIEDEVEGDVEFAEVFAAVRRAEVHGYVERREGLFSLTVSGDRLVQGFMGGRSNIGHSELP
jgi:hypothetical protein